MIVVFILNENGVAEKTKYHDDPTFLIGKIGQKIKTHYYESVEYYGQVTNNIINSKNISEQEIKDNISKIISVLFSNLKTLSDKEINYSGSNQPLSSIQLTENYLIKEIGLNLEILEKDSQFSKLKLINAYNELILLISALSNEEIKKELHLFIKSFFYIGTIEIDYSIDHDDDDYNYEYNKLKRSEKFLYNKFFSYFFEHQYK